MVFQILRVCFFLIGISASLILTAKTEGPEKIGNFLVPTSQQAGPLFGFGQNIIDQYDKQIFVNYYRIDCTQRNLSVIAPGFLYGLRNDLSILVLVPVTVTSQEFHRRSRGIGDCIVQIEYAVVNKIDATSATQATLVGALSFPTGSVKKSPTTGYGAPSFFLGGTLSYMDLWWATWIQAGALLPMKHNERKFGNQFLYQMGLEYCFATHCGWIFAGIIEGFGIYETKNKVTDSQDRRSGGTTIWIGPSLCISSQKILFQCGVALPVIQHLPAGQPNNHYYIDCNVAYTF